MKAIVIGAGLVGSLTAIYLHDIHGFKVEMYEKRSDIRKGSADVHRSINLVLTSRGIHALSAIPGLADKAIKLGVPVQGRMVHNKDLAQPNKFQPYGINANEVNYSVSRAKLNAMMLDECEKHGTKIHFDRDLADLDLDQNVAVFKCVNAKNAPLTVRGDVFFGTDGAGSATRHFVHRHLRSQGVPAADYIDRLGVAYKEVSFPANPDGSPKMAKHALHLWPRGPHFLMGLADLEGSFTGTLYLPDGSAPLPGTEGVPLAHRLQGDRALTKEYIEREMPDTPTLVPDLYDQLDRNQFTFLGTLRTTHWHSKGRAVLVGDAAHAVTPFLGQGMNLGFESLHVLSKLMLGSSSGQKGGGGLEAAFDAYAAYHMSSATSLADMAIENYHELAHHVAVPEWQRKKEVENEIESRFPTLFRSRYYLITKTLVPYRLAQDVGPHIEDCVAEIRAKLEAKKAQTVSALSDEEVKSSIAKHVTPFLAKHGIDLSQAMKPYYPTTPEEAHRRRPDLMSRSKL